jgi:hypothetical protein
VVSNARRCPYCGKSLIPFYQSFFFWFSIVAVLAAGFFYFVFFYQPPPRFPDNPNNRPPVALGVANQTSATDLPVGTTVDCNDMLITVISGGQAHVTGSFFFNDAATTQIYTQSSSAQRLLTTQWVMSTTTGEVVECYSGRTDNGESLSSGLEGRQLQQDECLTTRIYFVSETPASIVYLINPLDSVDRRDVSWLVYQPGSPD